MVDEGLHETDLAKQQFLDALSRAEDDRVTGTRAGTWVESLLTNEEKLARCIAMHGKKYDYSKTTFRGTKDKIKIFCPKHDRFFEQQLTTHFRGQGCPYCSGRRVTEERSLQARNPAVASRWHPTKNGRLTPRDVSFASKKKMWWKCPDGHEWQATVGSITRPSDSTGCPVCAGKVAISSNSLETLNPVLAAEWHSTLNNGVTPADVTAGSGKKAWWRCSDGHEWKATIASRARAGRGCPYCAGKKASPQHNLQQKFPEIATEFHPSRNGNLRPEDFPPSSNKTVWWQCYRGHDWKTSVNSRTNMRSNCPICNSRSSKIEVRVLCELRAIFDNVLWREKVLDQECDIYLPEFNIGVEIDGYYWHRSRLVKDKQKNTVLERNGIFLIRLRTKPLGKIRTHDLVFAEKDSDKSVINQLLALLRTRIRNRTLSKKIDRYQAAGQYANSKEYNKILSYFPGPLPENSLAAANPTAAAEWHPSKNGILRPEMFAPFSRHIVWWRCTNGHEWRAMVKNRGGHGHGCPYCAGKRVDATNSLATRFPEIAEQWHPTKNGKLVAIDVSFGSNKKVWWHCDMKHSYQANVVARTSRNRGCPYCAGKRAHKERNLAIEHPKLIREWNTVKNRELQPTEITSGSNKKVWWICRKGHEWQAAVCNRTGPKNGCPYCAGKMVDFSNSLASLFPDVAPNWHPTKNGTLTAHDVAKRSGKRVWWRCTNGHDWKATVASRTAGSGCPNCRWLKST